MNKMRKWAADGARQFIENERKLNERYRKKNDVIRSNVGAIYKHKKKK